MAPWLAPGDVLLVQREVCPSSVKRGEVVVFCNDHLNQQMVHRVIRMESQPQGFPFRTKGDRNVEEDALDFSQWKFNGVVTARFRNGKWKKLRNKKLLLWLSKKNLYPGQRLPKWLGKWRHPNLSDWLV
jgi:hypothetical protein